MITKPAVLECKGCGKVFIGFDRDPRPKGWPRCLKCSARQAWDTLAGVVAGGEARAAGGRKRRPAARAAKRPRAGARNGARNARSGARGGARAGARSAGARKRR